MPYYPQAAPGVLGSLAGAAATYFGEQQNLKDQELQRQYMQQQMQQAAALAPFALRKASSDADLSEAEAKYEQSLSDPMDPSLVKALNVGTQDPSEPFVNPNTPIAGQVAAYNQYHARLHKHLADLQHAILTLSMMPQTPNNKDAIAALEKDAETTRGEMSQANSAIREANYGYQMYGVKQQGLASQPLTPEDIIKNAQAQQRLNIEGSDTSKQPFNQHDYNWYTGYVDHAMKAGKDPTMAAKQGISILYQKGASQKTIDAANNYGYSRSYEYGTKHGRTAEQIHQLNQSGSGGAGWTPGGATSTGGGPVTNPQ